MADEMDFTPTTDEVREDYKVLAGDGEDRAKAHAEFDRWLAEHDAALIEKLADEYGDSYRGQTHKSMRVVTFLYETARQRRERQDRG